MESQYLDISRDKIILQEILGEGQYGKVHRAYLNNKNVAVKICKDTSLITQEKFMEEALILQKFQHPNIIRLLGINKESNPWLIMEYASYGALKPYLIQRKSILQLDILLIYIHQISQALAYLETEKFIHRDIAARNILVVSYDCVKLGDFGLSRYIGEEDIYSLNTIRKLPIKWMSPESINYSIFTTKSDVWMFGVCMWEILSLGAGPFQGIQNGQIASLIEDGQRLNPPIFSPEALNILMERCWEYVPKHRPSFQEIELKIRNIIESREEDYGDFNTSSSMFAPPKPPVPALNMSNRSKSLEVPNKTHTLVRQASLHDVDEIDGCYMQQIPTFNSLPEMCDDEPIDRISAMRKILEEQQRQSEEDALWLQQTESHLIKKLGST